MCPVFLAVALFISSASIGHASVRDGDAAPVCEPIDFSKAPLEGADVAGEAGIQPEHGRSPHRAGDLLSCQIDRPFRASRGGFDQEGGPAGSVPFYRRTDARKTGTMHIERMDIETDADRQRRVDPSR